MFQSYEQSQNNFFTIIYCVFTLSCSVGVSDELTDDTIYIININDVLDEPKSGDVKCIQYHVHQGSKTRILIKYYNVSLNKFRKLNRELHISSLYISTLICIVEMLKRKKN